MNTNESTTRFKIYQIPLYIQNAEKIIFMKFHAYFGNSNLQIKLKQCKSISLLNLIKQYLKNFFFRF